MYLEDYFFNRMELLQNQDKQYNWEQDQIAHMKNYISRFGHGSIKLARQAQSKEKTLASYTIRIYFTSCGTLYYLK